MCLVALVCPVCVQLPPDGVRRCLRLPSRTFRVLETRACCERRTENAFKRLQFVSSWSSLV